MFSTLHLPRIRPFYGWWIALAGMVQLTITAGTGFYSFGIFYKPLIAEFGWTRAQVSAVTSFYYLGDSVGGPFIGRWIDRHGPMRTMLIGALISGALFLTLSLIDSLWQLYLVFVLIAWCYDAMGAIPVAMIISRWYVRRRGTMSSVAMAGLGMGGAVIAPLSAYLVATFGWRVAFQVLAFVIWCTCLPLILFVVKPSPQSMNLQPDGDYAEPMSTVAARSHGGAQWHADTGWPFDRVIRTVPFWLIAIMFLFGSMNAGGVLMHQFPFLTDGRMDYEAAAAAVSVTGILSVVAKIVFGYLADRVMPRVLLTICYTVSAISLAIAILIPGNLGAWTFVLLYGLSMGPMNSLRPLIVAQSFGLRAFGRALGLVMGASAIGYAAGPFLAGLLFDIVGNYSGSFLTFLILYVLAAGLIFFARVPTAEHSLAPRVPTPD